MWRQARSGTTRRVLVTLLALFIPLTNWTTASANSSPQKLSDAERIALCSRAVEELEAARALLADYEKRLDTAREEIRVAGEKDAVATATIAKLEESVTAQKLIVANLDDQVKVLTAEVERVKKERDSAAHRGHILAVLGVAFGVVVGVLAASAGGN